MVKIPEKRCGLIFKKIFLAVKKNSYLNLVIYNMLTVNPINLDMLNYGSWSVFIFIYLMSLLCSFLSPWTIFDFKFLTDNTSPMVFYVYDPLLNSIILFLVNSLLLFVIQVIGCHLIGKSKNFILYGIFSSILVWLPILVVLSKFIYFLQLMKYALGLLSVYFVQNSLDMTFGYNEKRVHIIHYVVLYVAFQFFFYVSMYFHGISFFYILDCIENFLVSKF